MTRSYRLGCTSFVHPGGWQFNVERLAGLVDDIEILFFEAEGADALPSASELRALAELKAQHGLSYSLHTPLAASLASQDEARRAASVRMVLTAIQAAQPLAPEAYVLHVYHGEQEHDPSPPLDTAAFRRRAERSLREIVAAGVPATDCCIELLDYDFELIAPVVYELGLSIALDVGHLQRDGIALQELVLRHLPRTRLIQWHGTDPSDRDHRSLRHFPTDQARWLLQALREARYAGVLTLEVFRADDLHESLDIVRQLEAGLDQNSIPR